MNEPRLKHKRSKRNSKSAPQPIYPSLPSDIANLSVIRAHGSERRILRRRLRSSFNPILAGNKWQCSEPSGEIGRKEGFFVKVWKKIKPILKRVKISKWVATSEDLTEAVKISEPGSRHSFEESKSEKRPPVVGIKAEVKF